MYTFGGIISRIGRILSSLEQTLNKTRLNMSRKLNDILIRGRSSRELLRPRRLIDDHLSGRLIFRRLLRLWRLLVRVERPRAARYVEKLREVGGLFVAARPAFERVVENGPARMKLTRI